MKHVTVLLSFNDVVLYYQGNGYMSFLFFYQIIIITMYLCTVHTFYFLSEFCSLYHAIIIYKLLLLITVINNSTKLKCIALTTVLAT